MSIPLIVAAVLAAGIGVAHTVLGERYLIRRLLRREDLPHLFGGQAFTRHTIRFAWHLTSLAWIGFAAVLVILADPGDDRLGSIRLTVAITFLASAVLSAAGSRLRHLSWMVFLAIAVLALLA